MVFAVNSVVDRHIRHALQHFAPLARGVVIGSLFEHPEFAFASQTAAAVEGSGTVIADAVDHHFVFSMFAFRSWCCAEGAERWREQPVCAFQKQWPERATSEIKPGKHSVVVISVELLVVEGYSFSLVCFAGELPDGNFDIAGQLVV